MSFGFSDGLTTRERTSDSLLELLGTFRTPWLAARWLADRPGSEALAIEQESENEVVALLGGALRVALKRHADRWRCEEATLLGDDGVVRWVVRFEDFRAVEGLRTPQPFLRTERRRRVSMPGQPPPTGDLLGPEQAYFATRVEVVDRLDDSVFILTEKEAKEAEASTLSEMRAQSLAHVRQAQQQQARAVADPSGSTAEASESPESPPSRAPRPVDAASGPKTVRPETQEAVGASNGRAWYLAGAAFIAGAVGLLIWRVKRA